MAGDIDMRHARALLPLEAAQQILAAAEIDAKIRQTLATGQADTKAGKGITPANDESWDNIEITAQGDT